MTDFYTIHVLVRRWPFTNTKGWGWLPWPRKHYKLVKETTWAEAEWVASGLHEDFDVHVLIHTGECDERG